MNEEKTTLRWTREEAIEWLMEEYRNEELDEDAEKDVFSVRQKCIDNFIAEGLDDALYEARERAIEEYILEMLDSDIYTFTDAEKHKELRAKTDLELQQACNSGDDDEQIQIVSAQEEGQ